MNPLNRTCPSLAESLLDGEGRVSRCTSCGDAAVDEGAVDPRTCMTRIRTMKVLPLAEVKAHLSALAFEVESQHDQITITRNGAPVAMMVSVAEWESLQEMLAVLSDPQVVADLREAELSRAAGEVCSTDEVLADFAARRSRSA